MAKEDYPSEIDMQMAQASVTQEQATAFAKDFVDSVVNYIGTGLHQDCAPIRDATQCMRTAGLQAMHAVLGEARVVNGRVPMVDSAQVAARLMGVVWAISPAIVAGAGMSREVWLYLCGKVFDRIEWTLDHQPGIRMVPTTFKSKQPKS